MDRVASWLRSIAAALPDDSCAVTLSRGAILSVLGDPPPAAGAVSPAVPRATDRELTPNEIGELEGVQGATVRLWIRSGRKVRGRTVKLDAYPGGKGWLVSPAAYAAFREAVREASAPPAGANVEGAGGVLSGSEAAAYMAELYENAA
jgi:hypothetical protein